jgi:hypothetical protein
MLRSLSGMSKPPKKRPRLSDRALAEQIARKDREAEALRENLKKRKEQARARADGETPETIRPPR